MIPARVAQSPVRRMRNNSIYDTENHKLWFKKHSVCHDQTGQKRKKGQKIYDWPQLNATVPATYDTRVNRWGCKVYYMKTPNHTFQTVIINWPKTVTYITQSGKTHPKHTHQFGSNSLSDRRPTTTTTGSNNFQIFPTFGIWGQRSLYTFDCSKLTDGRFRYPIRMSGMPVSSRSSQRGFIPEMTLVRRTPSWQLPNYQIFPNYNLVLVNAVFVTWRRLLKFICLCLSRLNVSQ